LNELRKLSFGLDESVSPAKQGGQGDERDSVKLTRMVSLPNQSGQGESNPHSQLGKLMLGHSTMPARIATQLWKAVVDRPASPELQRGESTNPA
jgi:hypothetical protein